MGVELRGGFKYEQGVNLVVMLEDLATFITI